MGDNDQQKWLTFSAYCRKRFGHRLYRVALDAGFTCPVRDGTLSYGGCAFCSARGSGDFAIPYNGQKLERKDLSFNHIEAPNGSYIAYFQSYTNTYGSLPRMQRLFEAALSDELFGAISIATRPDCLGEDVLCLLKKLRESHPLKPIWVELGLQTMHDATADLFGRGYPTTVYDKAVAALHDLGIEVITHVIIGLPTESKEMVLETIRHVNETGAQGIKLQLLHYVKGSRWGDLYEKDPDAFRPLAFEEYVDIATDCLACLDESIVVHRLSGDGSADILLAPIWSRDKKRVLNAIRKNMKEKGYVQGCMRRKHEQDS